MKIEEARVEAYEAVVAAAAGLSPVPAIQWDNRYVIDMASQQDLFLAVDFVIGAAHQMSLGQTRVVRYWGQIAITVNIKEGQGIHKVTQVLDVLCLALGMKSFNGLNTQAATPQRPLLEKGWHVQPLGVPFWFDDVVTS